MYHQITAGLEEYFAFYLVVRAINVGNILLGAREIELDGGLWIFRLPYPSGQVRHFGMRAKNVGNESTLGLLRHIVFIP